MWPFGKKFPDQAYLAGMGKNRKTTPDVAQLDQRDRHLLFVVDDTMRGHHAHQFLWPLPSVRAFTYDNYAFWRKRDNSMAVPFLRRFHTAPFLPIRGELYAVAKEQIKALDIYNDNGVCFERQRITITVPLRGYAFDPSTSTFPVVPREEFLHAWMYVGKHRYWDDKLDGGWTKVQVQEPDYPRNCMQFSDRDHVKAVIVNRYYHYSKVEFG